MKDLEERQSKSVSMPTDPAGETVKSGQSWSLGLLFCTLGFIVCTLLNMTPLSHVPDYVIKLHFSAGSLLAGLSSWWPVRIGTSLRVQTTNGEFFLCLLLAGLCCALAALYIYRRASNISSSVSRIYIVLGALLAGLIYVITPAMLSHDIIVYASYSRVLATYHANPYFTPIAAFPADPFTSLNYWAKTVSAYGPIWTLICGAFGWLLSPAPEAYVLTFRLFALACHLLNIWLVGRVLVSLGRSSRVVTLGMLLYAWNPLVLLESGLGGHNDVFMLTFLLLGVLLAVRAEQRSVLLSARGYLPPLVALVLGALVKFTALPVLVVYLIWLACKILRSFPEGQTSIRLVLRNWQPILLMLIRCALTGLATALVFYGPFWIGHSLTEIIASFKNPPSAIGAENSFMRSVIEWLAVHSDQRSNPLVRILVSRSFWDYLNYGVIAVCLIIGARRLWQRPVARTFLLVSLATLSAVLLTTPWFYSWYITWIIGLAAVCLPVRQVRLQTALLALVLTFSFSALLTYPFTEGVFAPRYYLVSLFTTIPPVCAFLLTLVIWQPGKYQTTGDTIE